MFYTNRVILSISCFLLLFSCTNQNTFDEQSSQESSSINEDILDNQNELSQDEIKDSIETENKFCPDIKELDYFQKHGTITKTGDNNIIAEIKNDSLYIKVLFQDCIIRYRGIRSVLDCSSSFAKYYKGDLVIYDSTGKDCKHLIHYSEGIEERSDLKILPKYLRKEINEKARNSDTLTYKNL